MLKLVPCVVLLGFVAESYQ